MIYSFKKRVFFFLGILITGALGVLSGLVRTNSSKSESLVAPSARAEFPYCDLSRWTQEQCDNYFSNGGCFPAGTPISTPSGMKKIESLAVGDRVYGYDTKTGETKEAAITKTLKHSWEEVRTRSPLLIITHTKGGITLTTNHWVYRKNGRVGEYANFDRAGMLEVGDILTTESGEEATITKIEDGPEYDFVYNLEVEGVHTYFAEGIRVHNSAGGADCCGGADGSDGK